MDTSKLAQIEALLSDNPYQWAVQAGLLQAGESFNMAEVFTIRRSDVVEYLRTHPVPGLDIQRIAYRDVTDGPKILPQGRGYAIGWQERGIFTPEFVATDETSAREFWINFLAASRGLAA